MGRAHRRTNATAIATRCYVLCRFTETILPPGFRGMTLVLWRSGDVISGRVRCVARPLQMDPGARHAERICLTNLLRFPYGALAIRTCTSAKLFRAMKYACIVFLGCAASLFAQSVNYKPASSSPLRIPGGGHSFVAGDVDKDGHTDPVVAENKKLFVMLGDGKGGFAPAHVPPTPVTGVAGEMLVADFNGDGVLDFAGSHHERYEVVVMLGRLHRGQRR